MPKPIEKVKPYYLRVECWLPAKDCKSELDGRCRYWPPEQGEAYRKAYPELHRQIDKFRNKQL